MRWVPIYIVVFSMLGCITKISAQENSVQDDYVNQSGCLAVFTKDWFQSFLIKGSKIFHWTANHFSVFCFPWAKVWKNINILVIYHTNLFYVKFLQKCHQLSNFWFELFFYNSGHLQQLHFFLLWAGINPIFWKNAKFVNLWK